MNGNVDAHMDRFDGDPHSHAAHEEPLPQPSIAPAALAMGIMFLPWGILTHWSMSLAGLCLMGWAITKWVREIREEWAASDRVTHAATVRE